jgi:hypothetical protein
MPREQPLSMGARLTACGALALAVGVTGCGEQATEAPPERPLSRTEASLLAGVLHNNYRVGGARFQAAGTAGPGGGTITLAGEVDFKKHQGYARVMSDAGKDRVQEVLWDPSVVLEHRPGMMTAINRVKPGATVVARTPDRQRRRLDQMLEIITALATAKRENPLLLQQRKQATFIREDTLRGTPVWLLRYGPRTIVWVNPKTGQMLRFESSNKDRTAPIVVDIEPNRKVRIRPPRPEYVVSAQALGNVYARRATTSP